ncbi:cation-transporting ATPase [Microbacterium sp. 5K110]|uniref:cation-transporting ATPase n=1 Tax=unclassified Microbacterium TaxID=2609290 RepID=UPI0010FDBCFC|nr:cation-transporting ATPase [Microbacterium sp. 5K110]TLF34451.1 cation-transporting ATPase [Microbacterium sp. 5K110]
MSKFSRLFDLASRAVDKASTSRPASSTGSGGGTDWRDLVRTAAGAVTGDRRDAPAASSATPVAPGHGYAPPAAEAAALRSEDRAAIARYDYLLRTADPDQVERLHRDAFERLSPAQRAHVRGRMDAEFAPHERPRSDAPADLARAAGRAEAQRPGRMSALLARAGRGGLVGAGVIGAGGLLAAVAGGAIVSAVAAPLLAQAMNAGVDFAGLAEGLDVEALASGLRADAFGDVAGGAQDALSGAGEGLSGIGEQISGFDLPGLGDFFGR